MAATILELGLSNLVVASALAVLALAAGRWGKRPALTHALWLLVLLKLVTPPVIDLPVRLLPAETVAAPAPVTPEQRVEAPRPVANPEPLPVVGELPVEDVTRSAPPPVPVPVPPKLGDFDPIPPLVAPTPIEIPTPAENPPPASTPLIPLDPVRVEQGIDPSGAHQEAYASRSPAEGEAPRATESVAGSSFPWRELIVAVWVGGSVIWLALVAWRVRRFAQVLRLAEDVPPWFAREVSEMAEGVGLKSVPRVKLIPGTVAPMVWSLGRTTVYFPADLITMLSPQQRASLVAHELAHLKRGDHWVRWLELAALAMYWWCPLAWIARRELQRAEEECCDAWVVATLPAEGHTYATALLDTLDFLAEAPRAPALASGMGAAAAIKRRLRLILDGRTPKRLPVVGRLLVVFVAVLLLPVAPKLARLVGAAPVLEALLDEPKKEGPKKEEPKPDPKNSAPKMELAPINPRGEPLLYEMGSLNATEIRPAGPYWWAVAVSPNGKMIATSHGNGNTRGQVRLWDTESGKVKWTANEPKGTRAVVFSPDGKIIASGCFDAAVRFYDADTGTLWAIADQSSGGHGGNGVNCVCFIKDGKYLVTAGLDRTIRIWDVAAVTAKRKAGDVIAFSPVAVFEGHTGGVLTVAASADGRTLLSGGNDRTARAWDVPDKFPKMGEKPLVVNKERVLLQHNSGVEAIAVSPDGELLVTGSWDRQLLVRDRDGKKVEISATFQNPVMCATFSKDGKYLAVSAGATNVAGQPGEVRVWDVVAKREVAYRADFPEAVISVAFTPDGKTVAAVGRNQGLHLWPHAEKDRRTIRPEGITYTPQPILGAAISPNGNLLAFSNESKSVFVLDRQAGTLVAELTGHEDVVSGLAFSPDNKILTTASYDKTVKLWNIETWKQTRELKGHTGWVLGVAFSPDGKTLATGSYDKTVRLWNAETGELKATWKDHTAGVRSVAFSPDGKKLVSGGSDRIVRIWDAEEGKVLFPLKGHKGAVRSVAFSPDGKTVASGSEDRTVKVWDVATGTESKSFTNLPDMVTAIRFSPKGQTLVAAIFQGSVVVLDPITERTRQTLRAHNDSVTAAVFADDGQHLITVSLDRTIRQWPAVKPSAVAPAQTLAGKLGIITAVALTPNGKTAILGGADGKLTQWDLPSGRIVEFPLAPPIPGGVAQVAASADGLVAAVSKDGKFWVVPLARGRDGNWSGTGRFVCFTPDGKHLAVVVGKDVVLYDSATGKEAKKFEGGHTGNVGRVCFSPDGKLLASAGEDTKVRLWETATATKKQETSAFGNYSTITLLAFSPDGTRIAVAAYGPDRPPPDDMTGTFQVMRQVRVYPVPAADAPAFANNPIVFVPQPPDQPITGLDWLPGGQALVSPASDGTVRLTELTATSAREVQRFRAHESAVLASAVSAENGVFITAGEDMAVRRWRLPGVDPAPGQGRLQSVGLTRVWEALPSPDGRYLVAAGEGDKAFRVYTALPTAIPVEPDKYGSVYVLAFSPDNKFLVTGHDKGEVVIREAATGKPIRTLTGHKKRVSSIAFAENGAALVTVGGNWMNGAEAGEAIVWDFATGKLRHNLDAPSLQWMVAVHPNGKLAAGAGSDAKVRVWDLTTGKVAHTFSKGWGLYTVAFDADGSRLAAGSSDRHVRIWEMASGKLLREIAIDPNLRMTQTLFSPDGKEIVVSAWKGSGQPDRDPILNAYSIENPDAKPRVFPHHPASVMNLAFLPDGKTLVASGGEKNGVGSLRMYDYATAKPLGQFAGHRHWAQNLAISPAGKMIASTSWATPVGGELRLWDPRGFRPVAEVKVPGENQYISSAAISRDGKLLVLGGWGKTLTAWDMTDPAKPVLKKQLKDHTAGLRSVSFDSAGKRFVSSDESGVVKVWDAASLNLIVSFKASANGVYRAKFTPDGRDIVTVTGNWQARAKGEIRVWDPATGKETGRFPDQNREVWDIGFLAGGKLMVTVGTLSGSPDDAHLKVWDYATRQVVRMPVPSAAFSSGRCLAISSDGKFLALASSTGPVKVFDTSSWQEVLNVPGLTGCEFRVEFAPNGKNLVAANGEGAVIAIRLPVPAPDAQPQPK